MSSVASLRQIRRRIRSVENTKKITRAMEMVAAAKLRRFQDFLESARPYTEKMEGLLNQLLDKLPAGYNHPFLESGDGSEGDRFNKSKSVPARTVPVVMVIFTSDTGLCGTYNSELESKCREWIKENPRKRISFVFVGKHGAGALHKKDGRTLATFSDLRVARIEEILKELTKSLEKAYLHSEVHEVFVAYTRMETLSRYAPVTERLLPIEKGDGSEGDRFNQSKSVPARTVPDFLIEPDAKTVLDKLIPAFFGARLRFIFYHALLTEQIARMSAMRQATQNAKEMIDELTLLRNKARQASITKEIIEVVSGSRALKMK